MTPLASLKVALRALRVNALRSVLAMLGVIIGVGSVIVMVSISAGAKKAVEDQISSLGTNMLILRPGADFRGGRSGGAGSADPFTDDDVEALVAEVPAVNAAAGRENGSGNLVANGVNWSSGVEGVGEQYIEIRDWNVADGRNFYASEVRSSAKVAVVGQTIVDQLFGGAPAIGARVRINNVPFEIVGIMEVKGTSSRGQDEDDVVFVPISTARQRLFGGRQTVRDAVGSIYVEVAAGANMAAAQAEIEDLLRVRRDIAPGADDDFRVFDLADFIRARNETESQLGLLLAATAVISLVVGGIGIMNIMLVSVTERTREIGLRLAVGARRRDVRDQFLTEAVVLCLTGGLLGLILGAAGTMAIAAGGEFPVMINPLMVAIAIGSSAFVGVAFGFYPAHRASRMNPIEALRFE